MGRLVWFGLFALSPAGAVVALAALAISAGAAGYAAGRHSKKWHAPGA